MKKGTLTASQNAACLVCRKKSAHYKTYEQWGIEIRIPLCMDHYHSIDARSEAARQPVALKDDWAGARKMEHYCHEPLSRDTFHTFWIAQLMTENGVVAVGKPADGDDQRTDCTVALARFTTAERAQAFAEDYLARESQKGA